MQQLRRQPYRIPAPVLYPIGLPTICVSVAGEAISGNLAAGIRAAFLPAIERDAQACFPVAGDQGRPVEGAVFREMHNLFIPALPLHQYRRVKLTSDLDRIWNGARDSDQRAILDRLAYKCRMYWQGSFARMLQTQPRVRRAVAYLRQIPIQDWQKSLVRPQMEECPFEGCSGKGSLRHLYHSCQHPDVLLCLGRLRDSFEALIGSLARASLPPPPSTSIDPLFLVSFPHATQRWPWLCSGPFLIPRSLVTDVDFLKSGQPLETASDLVYRGVIPLVLIRLMFPSEPISPTATQALDKEKAAAAFQLVTCVLVFSQQLRQLLPTLVQQTLAPTYAVLDDMDQAQALQARLAAANADFRSLHAAASPPHLPNPPCEGASCTERLALFDIAPRHVPSRHKRQCAHCILLVEPGKLKALFQQAVLDKKITTQSVLSHGQWLAKLSCMQGIGQFTRRTLCVVLHSEAVVHLDDQGEKCLAPPTVQTPFLIGKRKAPVHPPASSPMPRTRLTRQQRERARRDRLAQEGNGPS